MQSAAWDPPDPANIPWLKNHYKKADLAEELYRQGILRTNVKDTLLKLNGLRKDIAYEDPGPDLEQTDLGSFVEEVASAIAR